jgi:hypothetical protein
VIAKGNGSAMVTSDSNAVSATKAWEWKNMEEVGSANYRIPVSSSFAESSWKQWNKPEHTMSASSRSSAPLSSCQFYLKTQPEAQCEYKYHIKEKGYNLQLAVLVVTGVIYSLDMQKTESVVGIYRCQVLH